MNQPRRDPGGPVVAVCAGQYCRVRRARGGPEAGIEPLKSAVSQTRGALLISTGCLGRCHLAAVVVLVWRGEISCEPIALAGMETIDRSRALTTWLTGAGPATALLHGGRLPALLAAANADARSR